MIGEMMNKTVELLLMSLLWLGVAVIALGLVVGFNWLLATFAVLPIFAAFGVVLPKWPVIIALIFLWGGAGTVVRAKPMTGRVS